MKQIVIILLAFIFLNGCKNGKDSKNEPLSIQDSITETKILNKENTASGFANTTDSTEKDTQDDWYWKNTVMSKNDTFENWNEGEATLVMTYKVKPNDSKPRTFKVGSITSEGVVTIDLPKEIKTETTLGAFGNLVFYDIQDVTSLAYNNGNTGYLSNTTLRVEKKGVIIGNLTVGNSVRTTYNLTNQGTLTMGDEGYILYWAYVDEASGLKGTEIRKDKVRRDGTNTLEVETTVIYDLTHKPGWNLIKTEVIGSYNLEHERGLNASWFKKHKHTVINEIPEDASYYFRKVNN